MHGFLLAVEGVVFASLRSPHKDGRSYLRQRWAEPQRCDLSGRIVHRSCPKERPTGKTERSSLPAQRPSSSFLLHATQLCKSQSSRLKLFWHMTVLCEHNIIISLLLWLSQGWYSPWLVGPGWTCVTRVWAVKTRSVGNRTEQTTTQSWPHSTAGKYVYRSVPYLTLHKRKVYLQHKTTSKCTYLALQRAFSGKCAYRTTQ